MALTIYEIIRRPIITEKGLGVRETQHTAVFEVAKAATKADRPDRDHLARPFVGGDRDDRLY